MKIEHINEPELEFASGRHVDVRFGIASYGPCDLESQDSPREIKIAIIGTGRTIDGVRKWLNRCREEIPAKPSAQPNLYAPFPGFNLDTGFRSTLSVNPQVEREIKPRVIEQMLKGSTQNAIVEEAVNAFLSEVEYVAEKGVHVIICAPPLELMQAIQPSPPAYLQGETDPARDIHPKSGNEDETRLDFHDKLKAEAMEYKKPLQIIWPATYDSSVRHASRRRPDGPQQLQDEATRAWNIHAALYYKAGGVPWRLIRDSRQHSVSYVGISFYETLDKTALQTSMAQVFNERGEGVVVRGGAAKLSKEDRQPHLDEQGAHALLKSALSRYKQEHGNYPARIAIHKSSSFNDAEITGFKGALEEEDIAYYDFVSITSSYMRLFRVGYYPPLRGTFLSLDDRSNLLYTRGSVEFFRAYRGGHVPKSLLFRCDSVSKSPRALAEEILALTKMNWNSTLFDGRDPITVRAAEQVKAILKYVDEGKEINTRYSTYM
jgi:hypothetical protein